MTPELYYLIGTLAQWSGVGLIFGATAILFRIVANRPGTNLKSLQRDLWITVGAGLVLLLIGRAMPMNLGRPLDGSGVQIPVVWVYMHFYGWLALLAVWQVGSQLVKYAMGIAPEEKTARLKTAGVWLVVLIGSIWLFKKYGYSVTIFRGAFYLAPTTIAIVAGLAVAAIAAMIFVGRTAKKESFGKTLLSHAVLLAGCVVFGLPFAWLLSSSFKEDRDINGGIMWIPKVTQRVPYFDPANPIYEAKFQGMNVTAAPLETLPNGKLQLNITEPLVMQGWTFEATKSEIKEKPKMIPVAEGTLNGQHFTARVISELDDGRRRVEFMTPDSLKGQIQEFKRDQIEDVRPNGLNFKNYPDALQYMPPETFFGLVYLKNTLFLVLMTVIGTVLSCSLVAYGFARLRFPGKNLLFTVLLSTMMLPAVVTLQPQFLIFKQLHWIDTLYPLWVPSFFAGAFNVFMLRQFFSAIPMELEDAAKIDGCSYPHAFWLVMLPQVKPALAVVTIWTVMGTWNNFLGPLIYVNSPEKMPISYALQLFSGERSGEPGLLMAFAVMSILPVLLLFFFAQKYFIEGVSLSGLGGR